MGQVKACNEHSRAMRFFTETQINGETQTNATPVLLSYYVFRLTIVIASVMV